MSAALRRARPAATMAAAFATVTASLSVVPLFDSGRWIVPTVLAVLAMAVSGSAARAAALPAPLQPILQVLVLLTLLTLMFAQPAAALGLLPGPMAIGELQYLTGTAITEAEAALAPVPTTSTLVLLAVGGIGLVALVVDTIGVTLRMPALAGLPLLLVYALPAAVIPGGVPWWLLPLAVLGWLLLLAADARDNARDWGPLLTRRRPTASGPLAHPRTAQPRVPSGVAAVQVGLIAVIAALVLPTVVPGLSEPVWVTSGGAGAGSGGPLTVDPFVSLRRNLLENPDREVLRYRSSSASPGYLRLVSLDTFDGVTWTASPTPDRVPAAEVLGPPQAPGVSRVVEDVTDVRVTDLDNAQIPLPYAASAVEVGDGTLDGRWTWDPPTRTIGGEGASSSNLAYRVTSYTVDPTRAELRAATKRAPDVLLDFLRLPADLTPDLGSIAAEVTADAGTPYARAEALVDFFTRDGGFSYSTNVVTPPGSDPLQSFLDERIGYCQQFAGTMALMARSVGIPSRVVVGFTSGRLAEDGEYVVEARNAHAWPELWFAGVGWTRFEPTPRIGAGVAQPDYSRDPRTQEDSQDRRRDPERATDTPRGTDPAAASSEVGMPPLALVGALALLVVVLIGPAIAVAVRRRRRTGHADPRHRIESTWRDLSDAVTDLGWAWSQAATPRDSANALARQVSLDEEERAALRRLVWWVEQVRYAPPSTPFVPPAPAELRADLRVLRRAADRATIRSRRVRARLLPASLVGRHTAVSLERVQRVERMSGSDRY